MTSPYVFSFISSILLSSLSVKHFDFEIRSRPRKPHIVLPPNSIPPRTIKTKRPYDSRRLAIEIESVLCIFWHSPRNTQKQKTFNDIFLGFRFFFCLTRSYVSGMRGGSASGLTNHEESHKRRMH